MKTILFALLISALGYSQPPNYTLYDCITLRAKEATREVPEDTTACYTTAIVTENWVKPTYKQDCNCFVNEATSQEQEMYEALEQAKLVQETDMTAENTILTTVSNTILNSVYPYARANFTLFVTRLNKLYIKVNTAWREIPLNSISD